MAGSRAVAGAHAAMAPAAIGSSAHWGDGAVDPTAHRAAPAASTANAQGPGECRQCRAAALGRCVNPDRLEGNGRRVILYADLKALGRYRRGRRSRIEFHLNGIWNGGLGGSRKKFSEAARFAASLGNGRVILATPMLSTRPIFMGSFFHRERPRRQSRSATGQRQARRARRFRFHREAGRGHFIASSLYMGWACSSGSSHENNGACSG